MKRNTQDNGRGIVMLSVIYAGCHTSALYAECHLCALYPEFQYAIYHYSECLYAQCSGARLWPTWDSALRVGSQPLQ